MKQDNELINPQINNFKNNFIYFKNKFLVITKINKNDKIGIINNNIYLDLNHWARYLKRRYYNQNYIIVNNFLKYEFNNFIKFLDNYLEFLNVENIIIILTNKIYNYINDIIEGLHNLKISYNNNNVIKITINSIILTLYEFNERVSLKLCKNKRKFRKNSI